MDALRPIIIITVLVLTFREDIHRVTIPGPPLELPGRPHHKHGHHSIPVCAGQFERIVYHPVRHCGAVWLQPLEEDLILTLAAGRSLGFRRDESVVGGKLELDEYQIK